MTKKRSFLYYNYFSKQKHIHTIWIRFDSKLETYKNLRMAGANAVALNAITAATSTDKRNENFAMVGWYVRIIFNYLVSMVADGSVRDGDERWWDAALLMCAAVVKQKKEFLCALFSSHDFCLDGRLSMHDAQKNKQNRAGVPTPVSYTHLTLPTTAYV